MTAIHRYKWTVVAAAVLALAAGTITYMHAVVLPVNADPRMVLQPWLLAHGSVQYVNIADEHSPLLPQIMAWLLPFAQDDAVLILRLVHATLVLTTVLLVLVWTNLSYGLWAALAAGVFILRYSSAFGYWGMWYNLALAPLYFAFFVALSRRLARPKYNFASWLLAGSIAGVGVLVKQHAVTLVAVFVVFLSLLLISESNRLRKLLLAVTGFGVGMLIPATLYLGYYFFVAQGSLESILYWSIFFNLQSGYESLGFLLPTGNDLAVVASAFLMLIPYTSVLLLRRGISQRERSSRILLLACLIAAMWLLYPRYSVPHWSVAFGFLAAATGVVCSELLRAAVLLPRNYRLLLRSMYVAILVIWLGQWSLNVMPNLSGQVPQTLYKLDHLDKLADILEEKIPHGNSIVLFPDNEAVSNLYYLLSRRPPSFWIMNYPWFMNDEAKNKWLAAMDEEMPDTLLFFENLQDLSQTAPELEQYVSSNYLPVESIEWERGIVTIMHRVSPLPESPLQIPSSVQK